MFRKEVNALIWLLMGFFIVIWVLSYLYEVDARTEHIININEAFEGFRKEGD